ncbi:hypothetical protein HPP92_027555, partial [Vanilla planifolia]
TFGGTYIVEFFDLYIGSNVEKVQYKIISGKSSSVKGLGIPPYLIYVVDSLDRERIGKAKAEFQKGAMTPMEVCEGLGLYDLRNRVWHIQGTCALKGDGLYEGLDWLASSLKELQAMGRRPPLALPLSDLSYRLGSLDTIEASNRAF